MNSGYWEYYDDNYDWDDSGELCRPDLDLTRTKLQEAETRFRPTESALHWREKQLLR